jgi:hypothetical protein
MIKQKKPRSEKQKQNDAKLSNRFKEMHLETKKSMNILDKITSDTEYLKKPIQLKVGFKNVDITPEQKIKNNKKYTTHKIKFSNIFPKIN